MKINLYGPFARQDYNKTEEGIKQAFEDMGHKVKVFPEDKTIPSDLINNKADLLLFFKGGIRYGVTADMLAQTLDMIDYPKICWFWDKVWGERVDWMHTIVRHIDLGFLSDGEFVRKHNYLNLYELRQGTDKNAIFKGKKKEKYKVDIAFTGQIYGDRVQWYNWMKKTYGDKFQIFKDVWGKELNDLCASAKIITAPKFPQNDYYCSQRPYEIMGRGGFMLHPYLEVLAKQFKEGDEIEFYRDANEFDAKAKFYLANDEARERIKRNAQKKIRESFTFEKTIKDILDKCAF